jgi:hypothetical protein
VSAFKIDRMNNSNYNISTEEIEEKLSYTNNQLYLPIVKLDLFLKSVAANNINNSTNSNECNDDNESEDIPSCNAQGDISVEWAVILFLADLNVLYRLFDECIDSQFEVESVNAKLKKTRQKNGTDKIYHHFILTRKTLVQMPRSKSVLSNFDRIHLFAILLEDSFNSILQLPYEIPSFKRQACFI